MSDNVVKLGGGDIKPVEVDPVTVADAERFVEMVRSGEVVGFCAVMFHQDECVSSATSGFFHEYTIIGGIECLKARIVERSNE
jgi:hypothetical protein